MSRLSLSRDTRVVHQGPRQHVLQSPEHAHFQHAPLQRKALQRTPFRVPMPERDDMSVVTLGAIGPSAVPCSPVCVCVCLSLCVWVCTERERERGLPWGHHEAPPSELANLLSSRRYMSPHTSTYLAFSCYYIPSVLVREGKCVFILVHVSSY